MATNTSQVSPEAPRRRQEIPDELAEIVARSLQVGASTGASMVTASVRPIIY